MTQDNDVIRTPAAFLWGLGIGPVHRLRSGAASSDAVNSGDPTQQQSHRALEPLRPVLAGGPKSLEEAWKTRV